MLEAPHEFLVRVREGSHAFQGVTKATLSRGEAYEFLELGAHLERADATARVLLTSVPSLVDGPGDRLSSLLRSCGGFEAFRRHESQEVQGERVVEFLLARSKLPPLGALLRRALPRGGAVRLRQLAAARAIARDARRQARVRGRAPARCRPRSTALLDEVLEGLHVVGSELGGAYFATRVVLPGPYAQQQQQQ